MNQIIKLLFTVWILPAFGKFVSNSTQIIADLTTVQTNVSSTQTTRAIAPAGPIMDVNGVLASLIIRAQEMKELLAYLLGSSQVYATTGGIFQTGDANATTGYNLLLGIAQILV